MRKVEAGRTERAEAGGSCGHETVSIGYGGLGNHTAVAWSPGSPELHDGGSSWSAGPG